MDVDDAHTHITDPKSLARAIERDLRRPVVSDEGETLRGGFRLMSLGKTRELRLHTTVSHASAASSSPLCAYTPV